MAEREAAAESWLGAADTLPAAASTPNPGFHYGSRLQRCLDDGRPSRSDDLHAVTLPGAALFYLISGLLGADYGSDCSHLMGDTPVLGSSSSYLHQLVFLRMCGDGY